MIWRLLKGSAAVLALALAAATAPGAYASDAKDALIERVNVTSHDGTRLGGWVIRPATDPKAKLPAIMISTPYFGQCVAGGPCWPEPATPEDWAAHPEPVEFLVENGYAVGWFSTRGTGVSGGCWDDLGRREQRDAKVLVDWLADQPWSNGRVGAMGLSAMSATALAAATQRPAALKTVVLSGIAGDLYTFLHSEQGLPMWWTLPASEAVYGAPISLLPPGLARGWATDDPTGVRPGNAQLALQQLPSHRERACPEVVRTFTTASVGAIGGFRDRQFFEDRDMTGRYGKIRASVLIAQGLQDLWQSGHKTQEDQMWSQLKAPRAMYIGQWQHSYPWMTGHNANDIHREDLKDEWLTLLRSWLDHYLEGGPEPRLLGRVRFEDDGGTWHESRAWPPRESRDEALFLRTDDRLTGRPQEQEGGRSYRSYPQAERATAPRNLVCPALLDPLEGPATLVHMTEPVTERTVLAGNPMAYLDLSADQTGGAVQVHLFDVGPELDCQAGAAGRTPKIVRKLTVGGADLRFHHGGYDARPFRGGHVRIDLANIAAVLEPGRRLAMTVGSGDPMEYAEVGHTPRVTVRSGPRVDASQLVVPVLKGGFGGSKPTTRFPPRP